MKQNNIKNYIGTIAVLFVFIILTVSVVILIISGTSAFKRLNSQNENAYQKRTISRFISNKLNSADSVGDIYVEQIDDIYVLCIRQTYSEKNYYNLVFCCDGYIRELLVPQMHGIDLHSGEKIVECTSMNASSEDGLLMTDIVLESGDSFRLLHDISGGAR